MLMIIRWKGHRRGADIREVKRMKLTKEKLYLWNENKSSEILLEYIYGFETIIE